MAQATGFSLDEVIRRLTANPSIALTQKNISSLVFSFGRDHGLFGRILNQTVIPLHTLTVKDETEVIGGPSRRKMGIFYCSASLPLNGS